jgi:demethoxyubiquinone hydroxylase (CLK1/Coq7/Cat5 family)
LLSAAENKTIARILKVNHAGEHGANSFIPAKAGIPLS